VFDFTSQIESILDVANIQLSTIKPSDWCEQNRTMDSSVSRFEGKFSYNVTPYTREIVDCLAPDHPARIIAVMKGAQIGFSTGVIEPGVGWIISQNPGNILFLTGHSDLSEEAVLKIDNMIDSCGIRNLIRPNVMRSKSNKTGDTNAKKEFPGGSLVSGSASNHKLLRQRSVRYGFIDDFEAAKGKTKESGSTRKMIEQRFASYSDKMKLYYISTPELKQTSNIEPTYLLGDQRKYLIPCPCCGEFIELRWSTPVEGTDDKEMAGITWKTDARNRLIKDSVGYICQKCGDFFTDKNKYELNLAGFWQPTAEPSQEGFYSYHISSLYAPPGMYDWKHYVNDWLEANPEGGKRNEEAYKAFQNLVLGFTYEEQGEAPKANQLQKNIRNYEIGIIPDRVSQRDGNGTIVLLTCACDLNGTEDDARLDYEILAHAENGATYSVKHGSIGTFVPRENTKKHKEDRERWTYQHGKTNSVWPEFDKILATIYLTDTNKRMKIFISGVDTGHYTKHAYDFIDKTNKFVIGLKGKDTEKFIKQSADLTTFRKAKERNKLYLVEVNVIKDDLADLIKLKWNEDADEEQPAGFMNYPIPSGGLYLFHNYFSHYEAEERRIETKEGEGMAARWVKKSSNVQNHFFDVRIYNMVLKDILVDMVCKELKMKNFGWSDYVDVLLGRKTS
jgi:phage terminase large subunit GpA-like protein